MKRRPSGIQPLRAVFLLLFLFSSALEAKEEPGTEKVWALIRPIQCLGNPWEKQWLSKHKNQAAKYPRAKEFELMKAYFQSQGIPILNVRVKPYAKGDPISQNCDGPRGDILYLLIFANDAPKMARLGYTERLPVTDLPEKK